MMVDHCVRAVSGLVLVLAVGSTAGAALSLNPARPIAYELTVQPIVVSNNDGSDPAEFFGNSSQQSSIESLIDQIWAQAGVDVDWLSPNAWNHTAANQGTIGLGSVVSTGDAAGVDSDVPTVLNMYFVEGIQGFGGAVFGENTAAGIAFSPGNGVTQYVGSNLLGWSGGREVIASVVAHEIGHNLGLPHPGTQLDENLMNGSGSQPPVPLPPGFDDDGERLTTSQINIALGSSLLVPAVVLGDMNGDGSVTSADAQLLVMALTNRAAYDAAFPALDADALGDVDGSGTFDLGDLSGFSLPASGSATALLGEFAAAPVEFAHGGSAWSGGAAAPSVPEPGSAVLLAGAGLALVAGGRRGRRRLWRACTVGVLPMAAAGGSPAAK